MIIAIIAIVTTIVIVVTMVTPRNEDIYHNPNLAEKYVVDYDNENKHKR